MGQWVNGSWVSKSGWVTWVHWWVRWVTGHKMWPTLSSAKNNSTERNVAHADRCFLRNFSAQKSDPTRPLSVDPTHGLSQPMGWPNHVHICDRIVNNNYECERRRLHQRWQWRQHWLLKPRLHDTTCCQTGCQTQPVGQQVVSSMQTSNRLTNRLYNRFDNRLSNRLYNRFDNRLQRVNGVSVSHTSNDNPDISTTRVIRGVLISSTNNHMRNNMHSTNSSYLTWTVKAR